MSESRISVIIVNWNRCADLRRLLTDLGSQTQPADEIIVVDNGSTDGSPDTVERDFPKIRLISLHKNMGASFGRNVGIVAAKTELIAILDNDLRILDRHFLAKVRQSAVQHLDCGVISFHQVLGIWSPPPAEFQGRVMSLAELACMAEAGQSPVPVQAFYYWLFWVGACVIRRDVFDTVGLFDDTFDYGGEEWDFAYRCHAVRIRLLRDTGLWVVHTHSPQMRSKSARNPILKNMVIAQARYMPLPDLLLFLAMQFAKSSRDAIFSRTIGAFLAVCWQILTGWPYQVLRKRQPVSRDTMRRFYYLRTHRPERFADVECADTTATQFYLSRAKGRSLNRADKSLFVAMFE